MKCGDVDDIEEERTLRAGQILCGNAIDIDIQKHRLRIVQIIQIVQMFRYSRCSDNLTM